MKQYELWWAELPSPAGRRPVLLLGRNDSYEYLNKLVAAEVTTTIRGIPVEIPLGPQDGLAKACVVNCDKLRTVPKNALKQRISRLPPNRYGEVKRAVGYAFGWDELIDIAR